MPRPSRINFKCTPLPNTSKSFWPLVSHLTCEALLSLTCHVPPILHRTHSPPNPLLHHMIDSDLPRRSQTQAPETRFSKACTKIPDSSRFSCPIASQSSSALLRRNLSRSRSRNSDEDARHEGCGETLAVVRCSAQSFDSWNRG